MSADGMADSITGDRPIPASTGRIPADAEYWLALTRLPGVGRGTFLRLVGAFQSPMAAWARTDEEWREAGCTRGKLDTGGQRASALAWAKGQLDKLARSQWSLRVYGGEEYPSLLSTLHHPPPFLFVLGSIPPGPSIAVVGSRQSTEYGLQATRQLAGDLAAAGIVIVSGFARGIDTAAHIATLEAGGRTVAIWGSGPDVVYPRENAKLVDRVAETGAIVTEFPFGTPPEPQNFPVRNRLIAGLSSGVLVTQAQSRSGALLTAQHALEQGKDVYAVPGEIGRPQFVGVNELIKSGARIVTDAADILADFGMGRTPRRSAAGPVLPPPSLNPVEKRVWEGLGGSPCHLDRLAVSLKMTAQECAAVLVVLELKGVVKQSAGKMFTRVL